MVGVIQQPESWEFQWGVPSIGDLRGGAVSGHNDRGVTKGMSGLLKRKDCYWRRGGQRPDKTDAHFGWMASFVQLKGNTAHITVYVNGAFGIVQCTICITVCDGSAKPWSHQVRWQEYLWGGETAGKILGKQKQSEQLWSSYYMLGSVLSTFPRTLVSSVLLLSSVSFYR